jgi:sugar phosphate isomerase/epimerase
LVEAVGHPNAGVLVDTFHASLEEPSVEAAIGEAGGRLLHVRIADSNRRAPGWGELDFQRALKALERIGYRSWLSAEVIPSPTLEAAMAQVARWAYEALGAPPA